jgi:alpha-beta hydrolase superfamily lysophospholipase
VPKTSAVRSDHTYVDAHGVTIHYYVWKSPQQRAIVQLAHGLGEHALRYEHVAQALVQAGYSVYADDHRGHGETGIKQHGGDTARLGRLGPGGLRATIAALHRFTEIIRGENPGTPIVLLGHSWGSLMAQTMINTRARDFAAVVLTGTAYRTLTDMNGGDLNKGYSTPNEWLSRDPAVAKAFSDDPKTFYADTIKLFGLADALRLLGKPAKDLGVDIPILIMIGSADSLGGEKSVSKLASDYITRSGLTDVEAIVYPDARHEIFNETNRDEVIADLVSWLDARLPA